MARAAGAKVAAALNEQVNLIVVGESELLGDNWLRLNEEITRSTQEAFERGTLEIWPETDFWRFLGLDSPSEPRLLYTPAMIAELTGVSLVSIRLWQQRGFLIPARQIGRLAYFDFSEILAARVLRTLLADEISPPLPLAVSPPTPQSEKNNETPPSLWNDAELPSPPVSLTDADSNDAAPNPSGVFPSDSSNPRRTIRRMKKRLDALAEIIAYFESRFPDAGRVLLNLTLGDNKKTILFRYENELHAPSGERYFDFDATSAVEPSLSGNDQIEAPSLPTRDDSLRFPSETTVREGGDRLPSEESEQAGTEEETDYSSLDAASSLDPYRANSFHNPIPELTDENREEYRRAVGRRVVALCEAAWEMAEAKNPSEAIRLYRTALAIGGADAGVSFQLAELFHQMGDYSAARERYYMTLEMEEDHLEARIGLGRVLAKQGEEEDALAVFQGALAIHPNYLEVRLELGKLLFRLGRKSEAEDHLLRYRQDAPNSPAIGEVDRMLEEIRRQ